MFIRTFECLFICSSFIQSILQANLASAVEDKHYIITVFDLDSGVDLTTTHQPTEALTPAFRSTYSQMFYREKMKLDRIYGAFYMHLAQTLAGFANLAKKRRGYSAEVMLVCTNSLSKYIKDTNRQTDRRL